MCVCVCEWVGMGGSLKVLIASVMELHVHCCHDLLFCSTTLLSCLCLQGRMAAQMVSYVLGYRL